MTDEQKLEAYIDDQREAQAEQDANEQAQAILSLIGAIDALICAIDAFVSIEIESGGQVPDLWDELNTSERLAEFLISNGWRKP